MAPQLTVTFDYPEDLGQIDLHQAFSRVPDVLEQLVCATNFPEPTAAAKLFERMPELLLLAGAVQATPEGAGSGKGSISEKIFGQKHIEFDRTAVGISVLNWILQDDYEHFTECQPEGVRLSRESFDELRDYTCRVLQSNDGTEALLALIVLSRTGMVRTDAWAAMVAFMAVNDLTKIDEVVHGIEKQHGISDVDHDKVLYRALTANPDVSPSFARLLPEFKNMILEGLSAEFNIGQLMQGECPAGSLRKVSTLSSAALDFYLLHAFCDIAGAAGHMNEKGSLVMTEPTYRSFKLAVESLEKLREGRGIEEVYWDYFRKRADQYGLDVSRPAERALTRVACMLRLSNEAEVRTLKGAFESLPQNVQGILTRELNMNGTQDGQAILPYYAPAMFANLRKAFSSEPDGLEKGFSLGLVSLARAFQEGRHVLRERRGSCGVFTLFLSKIAELGKDPATLSETAIEVRAVGDDAEAVPADQALLPLPALRYALQEVPLLADAQRIAIVAVGGGSDCVQAAAMAQLLETGGKTCRGIVSVGRRSMEHAGAVCDGVYHITSETTGAGTSGRFLEPLIADIYPTYVVQDDTRAETLESRVRAAVKEMGPIDLVIALDTGGDALYPAGAENDDGKTTPDQDLRVLEALGALTETVITCEIACGVDSPPNASEVLAAAEARYCELSETEAQAVLELYKRLRLDGSDENRFGKTPYAWQSALKDEFGMQCLPLPLAKVLDDTNPWNPFVFIQPSMRGMFFMPLEKHISQIST